MSILFFHNCYCAAMFQSTLITIDFSVQVKCLNARRTDTKVEGATGMKHLYAGAVKSTKGIKTLKKVYKISIAKLARV